MIAHQKELINLKINNYLDNLYKNFDFLKKSLNLINPQNILNKGYSIILNEEGKLISSIDNVSIGEKISIQIKDGNIKANVSGKEKK